MAPFKPELSGSECDYCDNLPTMSPLNPLSEIPISPKSRTTMYVPQNHRRSARKVNFSKYMDVFVGFHLDDYTYDEYMDSWYTPEEMDRFKMEIRQVLKILNDGGSVEEDGETTIRGLEFQTQKGIGERTFKRFQAKKNVFAEQDRQYETYSFRPEHLALVYFSVSNKCQIEASIRGLMDEHIAQIL